MALALRLVRDAKLSSYSECVKWELKVGLNWVRDKEFWDGVNLKLRHKGEVKWLPMPGKEQLDSYFKEPKNYRDLNLEDVKDNALQPTWDYYKEYPDCVRLFCN